MQTSDGNDPISDDEIVYRRLPRKADYYNPQSESSVQWIGFKPNHHDASGISVWRAKYLKPQEAASLNARLGKDYYLVAIRAAELRRLGAEVVPTPREGGPGHATITSLSWERYSGDQKKDVRELAQRIAMESQYEVLGPFSTGNV